MKCRGCGVVRYVARPCKREGVVGFSRPWNSRVTYTRPARVRGARHTGPISGLAEREQHALDQLEHGRVPARRVLLLDRRPHEGEQLGRVALLGRLGLAAAGGGAAEEQAVERAQVVRRLELERVRVVLAGGEQLTAGCEG